LVRLNEEVISYQSLTKGIYYEDENDMHLSLKKRVSTIFPVWCTLGFLTNILIVWFKDETVVLNMFCETCV